MSRDGAPPAAAPRAQLIRGRLGALAKPLISLLLLMLLLRNVDPALLYGYLRQVDPGSAALGIAVLALSPAVSVPRWRGILRRLGWIVPAATLGRALYIGAFFSQILPSSVGGDVWRIWSCTRAGVPLGSATSSILIERLAGLFAVLLCFGAALPALLARTADGPARWGLWGLLVACLGVAAGIALVGFGARRLEGLRWLVPLARFGQALRVVVASGRLVGLMLATALAGQLVVIVGFLAISRSLGLPLSLWDCFIALPPALLIALMPITLGGWGIREGALVVILTLFGIAQEQALALSILFGMALLVSTLPGLFLWWSAPRLAADRQR